MSIIAAFLSEREDKRRQLSRHINLPLSELAFSTLSGRRQADEWIVKALCLFRTKPTRMFLLEELAQTANITVWSMFSRFNAIPGQTAHQYQMNLKLEMACAASCITCRTTQDIAAGYGFYGVYQFGRLFKKMRRAAQALQDAGSFRNVNHSLLQCNLSAKLLFHQQGKSAFIPLACYAIILQNPWIIITNTLCLVRWMYGAYDYRYPGHCHGTPEHTPGSGQGGNQRAGPVRLGLRDLYPAFFDGRL